LKSGGFERHKMNKTILIFATFVALCTAKSNSTPDERIVPRELDAFATNTMRENGQVRAAAPECKGQLGWVYHNGFCYMFTSYHETFLKAEEECNKVGAYLADINEEEENNWIKSVLAVINPKDGTDYWAGGLDADRNKQMQWITGNPMTFANFAKDQPDGQPYAHLDFDLGFAWNAKDDANDQDNGFICKRAV